jgi:hypothetical protein
LFRPVRLRAQTVLTFESQEEAEVLSLTPGWSPLVNSTPTASRAERMSASVLLEAFFAALVSEWNDLPTDVQRRLFEHAASVKPYAADLLKARIARFLHNHKDDWAAR